MLALTSLRCSIAIANSNRYSVYIYLSIQNNFVVSSTRNSKCFLLELSVENRVEFRVNRVSIPDSILNNLSPLTWGRGGKRLFQVGFSILDSCEDQVETVMVLLTGTEVLKSTAICVPVLTAKCLVIFPTIRFMQGSNSPLP